MPINIPIHSGDDDAPSTDQSLIEDEDVFEIDADSMEIDAAEVVEATRADQVDTDDSGGGDTAEAEEGAVAPPPPAPAAAKPGPPPPAAKPAARAAEISREALYELMQELRQKSEAVDRLTQEKNDLYDKLIRKQAEFENFRKRTEREAGESYTRARADMLVDLLPVLDNLELALMHADATSAEAILEGVQLIFKQLSDTLARFGLDTIDAENQPFDPEYHEAVATESSDDVPDHTVVAVMQRGYRLGDRLLRPARVKVAVQP